MKKYICEMCGKEVQQIHDHHIIPWRVSHDDSDSNIMRLCRSCHGKADANYDSLVARGEMYGSRDTKKRVSARYNKKYIATKTLFYLGILKRTYYQDVVRYNTKTGEVSIYLCWGYQPYKYRDNSIKSRAQLDKAASAKGQVTLGV